MAEMAEPPNGEHPGVPENEVEPVFLFDPTPRPPTEGIGAPPAPKRRVGRRVMLLLLVAALAGGGYQLYRSGAWGELSAGDPEGEPVVQPIVPAPPSGPVTLSAVDRDLQGRAGTSMPLEVRARSSSSTALKDSLVHFQVVSGGGVIDPDTARTDVEGIARTALTLPGRPGTVVVLATLDGSGGQTRLVVGVRAGAPQRIVAAEGDRQQAEVGELLPARVSVVVYDESGVPVPGAEVRFAVLSGGGVAAPSRIRTDSLGNASALWRLGADAGTQRLTATAVDVGPPVTFTATAIALPEPSDGNPIPVEAGPVTVRRRDFVIGGSHVCMLVGGVVQCRGANDRGQRGTSGTVGFVALVSGISHMCGLTALGEASCWGANEGGQLGDGSRTDRSSPVPVRTELRFSSLTAGASHTCGLAGGGIPVCWGQNLSGQIGDGSRTDARFPRAVGGGLSFGSLVAGWNHTCGLTANGNAFCWGQNSDGQLGDGSRLDRLVPTLVRGAIESLAAGNAHTCGISGDEVLCWGDNRFGQLGDGTTQGRPQPAPVTGLPAAATQVVAGAVHTCALMADGSAYCWGQNLHGQLGDGSTTNRNTAVLVAADVHFRSIFAGGALTCGFSTDGAEYCWGLNQNGQLGDGTRENRALPTRVEG